MAGIQIGQKQAREFALLIYKDIHKFCEEHKEEFEAFLQEEEKGGYTNELAESEQRNIPAAV